MTKAFPVLYGERVNNVAGSAKYGIAKHLQPGLVRYENPDGTTTTYLLELDAIEAMRASAAGIPVVGDSGDFNHVKVQPGKTYDGVVTDSFWDGESGWEAFHFDKMNAETAKACEQGYEASCAYVPTDVDETPGVWHNIPYDAVIKNGRYTHVAVVANPRYEGAEITLLNSKGGTVNKALKAILATLVPVAQLKEIVNSIEDDEKKKADEKKNIDDVALKARKEKEERVAALRNEADALEKDLKEPPKANAEAEAPKGDAPKLPVGGGDVQPEPGVPGQAAPKPNAEGAVAAEAKAEGESVAQERAEQAALKANAETPEQKAEREALEKNNASDAELARAWDQFADDMIDDLGLGDKAIVDLKTGKLKPLSQQPADVKALWKEGYEDAHENSAERMNSLGKKVKVIKDLRNSVAQKEKERAERFNALRRAAEERGGSSGTPFVGVVTAGEKENLGRERYGS